MILLKNEHQQCEIDLNDNQFKADNTSNDCDFDKIEPDPIIANQLDKIPIEIIESENELLRNCKNRCISIFDFYNLITKKSKTNNDAIEYREHFNPPSLINDHEKQTSRLLIKCTQLKLELQVEPIYASMALYDLKERIKISENFYFDFNSDNIKKMLLKHVKFDDQDLSTLSQSCLFNITYPSRDIFLVIRLDKVLQQGDLNDCIEPYLKYQSINSQNERNNLRDKMYVNSLQFCERLGRYRMPFAWTAVNLMSILQLELNDDDDTLNQSHLKSCSLDRSNTFVDFESSKKQKFLIQDDLLMNSQHSHKQVRTKVDETNIIRKHLSSFKPVNITINTFFKQDTDKLTDDDLYRYLGDLKKSTNLTRKLKILNGSLKIELSPFQHQITQYTNYLFLDSSLKRLKYSCQTLIPNLQIVKNILEFPQKKILMPNYEYQNLLYIYPLSVNFTNRQGSSARNIAIKINFMKDEQEHCALPVIFGRSSTCEFTKETYLNVIYHNKTPQYYDEVKIKLPGLLSGSNYHILFSYYHVSCNQNKNENDSNSIETFIGFSWLPLIQSDLRIINSGNYLLPIIFADKIIGGYSTQNPCIINMDQQRDTGLTSGPQSASASLIGSNQPIGNYLELRLKLNSTIHTQDEYLDKFILLINSYLMNDCSYSSQQHQDYIESLLKQALNDIHLASNESLINFLFVLLDKLFNLMMKFQSNISQLCLEAICKIVNKISQSNDAKYDVRNKFLVQYIEYACNLPYSIHSSSLNQRLFHEQLVFELIVATENLKELINSNIWFFFELLIKSISLYFLIITNNSSNKKDINLIRRNYLSSLFMDNVQTLFQIISKDVIAYHFNHKYELADSLNRALSFFLHDSLSVIDRSFTFKLIHIYSNEFNKFIKSYLRQINGSNKDVKNTKSAEFAHLYEMKISFLRILSNHEHFLSLNLPSDLSLKVPAQINYFKKHYLIGLMLKSYFELFNLELLNKVNRKTIMKLQTTQLVSLKNLFDAHDTDQRFNTNKLSRSIIANLYVPFLIVLLKFIPDLYKKNNFPSSDSNMKLANKLGDDSMKNLLISMLWILKNLGDLNLYQLISEWNPEKINRLLQVLDLALIYFEYKGKKKSSYQEILSNISKIGVKNDRSNKQVIKNNEENGKNEFFKHRKLSHFKISINDMNDYQEGIMFDSDQDLIDDDKDKIDDQDCESGEDEIDAELPPKAMFRWTKNHANFHRKKQINDQDLLNEAHLESNLSKECVYIVLDTIEVIIKVIQNQNLNVQSYSLSIANIFKLILNALNLNQTIASLVCLFSHQRALLTRFPELLFEMDTEYCAEICTCILRHCTSSLDVIRSQASTSLYTLMRQNFDIGNNFSRVKMQITMSLSRLVGQRSVENFNFNENYLKKSLRTILNYAESDDELFESTFPAQVRELVYNLNMILCDTVKMKEHAGDNEMLIDLMHRIANCYQNNPDLRLTWLQNIAQKHLQSGLLVEAGQCLIHAAGLVAEYLSMIEQKPYMPIGCTDFKYVNLNVLEESAVSDDLVSSNEDDMCTAKYFSESGLIGLIEQAIVFLMHSQHYEVVNQLYKILIPIYEAHRDYKKLSQVHNRLFDCFNKIMLQGNKRLFGTYFRVGFYGRLFEELDGEEFVYKEPGITKLSEIAHRLEIFYCKKFGNGIVEIMKDSNNVDKSQLDLINKAYIQITYVEPYFDRYELLKNTTLFERNYSIKRFIYSTPFTLEGKAHGSLKDQFKRKTILTTERAFPYLKTRIPVIERQQIVLTPVEVAIEDLQKKIDELKLATSQDPLDSKILQMVLQGCVGTTVNQGPLEMALTFLQSKTGDIYTEHHNKLRLCFKEFMRRCMDALEKNSKIIGTNQREYQKEMEKNYIELKTKIDPLLENRIKWQ